MPISSFTNVGPPGYACGHSCGSPTVFHLPRAGPSRARQTNTRFLTKAVTQRLGVRETSAGFSDNDLKCSNNRKASRSRWKGCDGEVQASQPFATLCWKVTKGQSPVDSRLPSVTSLSLGAALCTSSVLFCFGFFL